MQFLPWTPVFRHCCCAGEPANAAVRKTAICPVRPRGAALIFSPNGGRGVIAAPEAVNLAESERNRPVSPPFPFWKRSAGASPAIGTIFCSRHSSNSQDAALPTRRRRGGTGMAHQLPLVHARVAQPAEARRRERRQCGCKSCREHPFTLSPSTLLAMNPELLQRLPPPVSYAATLTIILIGDALHALKRGAAAPNPSPDVPRAAPPNRT